MKTKQKLTIDMWYLKIDKKANIVVINISL